MKHLWLCCCCSVAQVCPTLSYLMDYSTPGIPVLHHLLELAQTHAHWLSDAIQPSSPLSCLLLPQSFPASGSFLMSRLFTSGGQSIGASDSVLPMNIQDWFSFGLTGCSPRGSQESSPTPKFKSINSLLLSLLYGPSLTSVTTGKTIALTRWTFVSSIMSLLFNMLSRFVIIFLLRSKRPLISWLQSPSAVILEPKKIKSVTIFLKRSL